MSSAAAARRRVRARRVRVRRDLVRVAAGLIAIGAAAGLYLAVATPMPIREVAVSGQTRLSAADVQAAAGLVGQSIFRASSRDAEARVSALLGVKRARVSIRLPDRAAIEVEERVPAILMATARGRFLVDADGVLFPAGQIVPTLPVIEDDDPVLVHDRTSPEYVASVRAIAAHEPAFFGRAINRIRFVSSVGLVAVLEGGTEIRLGAAQNIDEKLDVARQIVLARGGKRLDYVDVRNRENPVFFPSN